MRRARLGQAEPTVSSPTQRRRRRTPRTHAAMSCPCRGRVDEVTLREPPCSAAYKIVSTPLPRDHQSAAAPPLLGARGAPPPA
jgi:hypothetical protein